MNRIHSVIFPGILLLTGLLWSCNQETANSTSPDTLVIYPPPPDTTRIQFLTQFSSSEDLQEKKGGIHRYMFGEEKPRGIIKPYGVTVHEQKVYINDTGLAGLVVLDLSEGTFEYFIPGGKGQLQLPINCCVDTQGNIYIADSKRKQIVVFDSEMKYIHAFGADENFKPTDVEFHEGKIYVANVLDHAVLVYGSENYELLGRIPAVESGEAGFIRQATNISISNDILYVSDFGDFNVKQFSLEGEFLGAIGGYGDGPGRFTRPKGLAVDREENLYVVDAAFENVQIFNRSRDLLMYFGGSYEGDGAMWLPAAVEISYENLSWFQSYVDESFQLKYLIYVTNQYGPAKVNVYGFVEEKPTMP